MDQPTTTRRGFLAAAGSLTVSFTLGGAVSTAGAQSPANDSVKPNAWVTIHADNTVTIVVPAGEMGQGTLTALPLILAEELDADWSRVRTEFAPPNPKLYGNAHPLLGGGQASLASIAVAGYFTPLRVAGGQARRVLLDAAAAKWNVPVAELRTESGTVVHAGSGRKLTYGEIAAFAPAPTDAMKFTPAELKKRDQYKLIGRSDIGRSDVASKVDGSARYGMDVIVPGMVYAAVLEAPLEGAKAENVARDEALAVPGITQVIPLPFGVAIIGSTVEATRMARHVLAARVSWNRSGAPGAGFDSEAAKPEYARAGQDPQAKALENHKRGDVASALSGAARVVEAAYWSEHAYHAQMEPMNCTVHVAADGQSAQIWVGTQAPMGAVGVAAGILKIGPEKIRLHQQLLGGGYGRRIAPDIVAQAVVIGNIVRKPVKLILSREDDMAAGRPRPMAHQVLRAALDGQGRLVGLRHRIVAENVDALAAPPRFQATGGKDYIGWSGSEMPFYSVPNSLSEGVRETRGMRVQPFRGIGSGYTKFAIESFMDEVAHARGIDPLAMRLELTRESPRATAVLQAVAEMAGWKKPRRGRSLGLAFADYHGTLSAAVAEISLDRSSGKIKVHNYWVAADPGLAIQPVNVLAQLEGAAVWGLSSALLEQATVRDGAIVQSNFNDYPVLRMSDMPEIHTRLVESDAPPTGMGEVGVLAVAPAIANALFALTGKRVRHMPMTPAVVKKALA